MQKFTQIGIIGLGAMGKNLAINFIRNNINVVGYDTNQSIKLDPELIDSTLFQIFPNIREFIDILSPPRVILMMVPAGSIVELLIKSLLPYLSENDILIDGGNSHFKDTQSRTSTLQKQNIHFVGMGISGGIFGALHGPSLMVGCNLDVWTKIKPLFQSISASSEGIACCQHVGTNGAGHFVKMVHNGIEYAVMELIAEVYNSFDKDDKIQNEQISEIFKNWNNNRLKSYLLEISSEIIDKKDESGKYWIDRIIDQASQKGTGQWTAVSALELGVPIPSITESVLQRSLSYYKQLRTNLSIKYSLNHKTMQSDNIDMIEGALYLSILLSYIQGMELIRFASKEYNWGTNLKDVLTTWKDGCIIRSDIIDLLLNTKLNHYLLDDKIKLIIENELENLKSYIINAIENNIPTPAMSASLNYILSMLSNKLPANLIQAQRDYFGSHGVVLDSMNNEKKNIEWY